MTTATKGKLAKRVRTSREGIDRTKLYGLDEAVKLVKERATAKFDETVEIAMNLGVDPRHADQQVRGVCNLPNGSGRTLRVAVFARGPRPMRPRPLAPILLALRNWSRASARARSTLIAASPRPI